LLAGVALVVIVLAIVAGVIVSTTRSQLIDQIDDRLAAAATNGRGLLFDPGALGGARGPDGDRPIVPPGSPPERQSDFYEGALDRDGNLQTFFVPNIGGEEFAPPVIDIDRLDLDEPAAVYFTTSASQGGLEYRVLAVDGGRSEAAFITALPLNDVESTINRLILIQLAGVLAILVVLGLVAWWMLRLGIRPIKQMTSVASTIAAGDLSARADESSPAAESHELAVALNTMLGTIETAMDERAESESRLRRFVADASHELRTPVTTIRGYAELYRVGGLEDKAALDDAMRRTEAESQRMARLVEDMLTLAKLDEERPLEHETVDLARLASDAAADARASDPTRNVTVDVPATPVTVSGDEDRLRQVFANVVTNAIVHTPTDVPVIIRVVDRGDVATVEIEDRGAGIPAQVVERVTERFFRVDPSRSRHRGGSGLGLSVVDATIEAHGGCVRITSEPGRGTTVAFDLPVSGTEPA
jgi:two-component system OmpR family sensor kinase